MNMDFRDIARNGLEEYLSNLKGSVDGLTPVELYWQPSPNSNHISWLVWHMARVEDGWYNVRIGGGAPVYETGGFVERWGLPVERAGFGDTAEDIAAFPAIPMSELLEYSDAVRASALARLDALTEADLERTISRPGRGDPPTIAWILSHVLVEEGAHLGQVQYLRGMLRGLGG